MIQSNFPNRIVQTLKDAVTRKRQIPVDGFMMGDNLISHDFWLSQ